MDNFLLFEIILASAFALFFIIFLYIKRKNIVIQKIIYPVLYLILYRSNFGIKFMKRFSKKYKEIIKFFGYCCIGIGFLGMIFISLNIILMLVMMILKPATDMGAALVLPFTNIPGIGYLSFIHWIIAIFILALIHEFAHGIVAKAHGLEIRSSGFAFLSFFIPIIPAAFVEPDEKELEKQPDIVKYSIFSAGPVINILLSLIILIALPYTGYGIIHLGNDMAPFESTITEPIGFSFDLLNDTYPASKAGMSAGIINEVNGQEVKNFKDFTDITYGIKPGQNINITTDKASYSLITTSSPDNPNKGFIGIRPLSNEKVVKEQYSWLKHPYFWIKELFKWLFIFNFLIGFMNLLPLGIVDGGRILKTLLEKTIKDQKKAKKVWSFIAFFFLAILLLGLITTYLGNPFSFLR